MKKLIQKYFLWITQFELVLFSFMLGILLSFIVSILNRDSVVALCEAINFQTMVYKVLLFMIILAAVITSVHYIITKIVIKKHITTVVSNNCDGDILVLADGKIMEPTMISGMFTYLKVFWGKGEIKSFKLPKSFPYDIGEKLIQLDIDAERSGYIVQYKNFKIKLKLTLFITADKFDMLDIYSVMPSIYNGDVVKFIEDKFTECNQDKKDLIFQEIIKFCEGEITGKQLKEIVTTVLSFPKNLFSNFEKVEIIINDLRPEFLESLLYNPKGFKKN